MNVDLAPFVRWEQDRQPLSLDDRVFKLPSGALLIGNATDSDGGFYRCVIESGGTPKYSEEAELKILPGINLFCLFVCLFYLLQASLLCPFLLLSLSVGLPSCRCVKHRSLF